MTRRENEREREKERAGKEKREGIEEREAKSENIKISTQTLECCFVLALGGSVICSAVFRLNAGVIGYTSLPYLA